ncbi:MAG: class I SAM-dependent methyltransferase [Gemmataceae bacterium]
MTAAFAYDAVAYRTRPMGQFHPDRLDVVGRLFGLSPAPAERCRYLEVGCGTGTHLIAAALALPAARFVGIDLSRTAIEAGRAAVAELGLANVELAHADLTSWNPGPEPFDYIAAHGVYSWVPAPVRDRLLALCGRALAPNGLAYISYNTYPGCRFREAVWDMLKFHTREATDPPARISAAKEFITFLTAAQTDSDDPAARLVMNWAKKASDPDRVHWLYHDDLSEVNDPVYLLDFVRHAGEHGLRFAAEAVVMDMYPVGLPPLVCQVLAGLADQDLLLKEQYLDFVRLRSFRQTVLCRAGLEPRPEPNPTRVRELFVTTAAKQVCEPGPGVAFELRPGVRGRIDQPLPAAVLDALIDRSPGRLSFTELSHACQAKAGSEGSDAGLVGVLFDLYTTGLIDLHGFRPAVPGAPGERPTASPLARREAAAGAAVTTLYHTTVTLDEPIRRLVRLLDGTRDRAAIANEMRSVVPADQLDANIDKSLAWLAKAGLLVS